MRTENRGIKYLILLVVAVGSSLGLLSATQTWFTVRLTDVADHVSTITVVGTDAAPALTALSLAGLALTAALAIGGPLFRFVLSLLGVLLGSSIVYSALSVLNDALGASSAAVTTATGVAGEESVRRLVDHLSTAFWPWPAVVGGALLALGSAAAVVTLRLWPGPSRKYQTRFAGADGRDAEEVLAEVSDEEEARVAAEEAGLTEPTTLDRDAAIDSWDELSRGDDPTR